MPRCVAILVYCLEKDWTRFCNVIGFENIRIYCPEVIVYVDLFYFYVDLCFSTLGRVVESQIKLTQGWQKF